MAVSDSFYIWFADWDLFSIFGRQNHLLSVFAWSYPSQVTAHEPETLRITFKEGQPVAVNGTEYADPVDAIRAVEAAGSKFGIGRDMHIGDTIIGIKGRVGFEAAGPILIIAAHKMLEKHTLTKWQQYWKDQIEIGRASCRERV